MLDFSDYDLVISSSSGFAHGARVGKSKRAKEQKSEDYKKNSEIFPPDKGGEQSEWKMGGYIENLQTS